MPSTLAIDFGARHIGIALVLHSAPRRNQILYAATVEVDAKPLNSLVETRAQVRRLRRTRKTHRSRLRRLGQALVGIPGAELILLFCRRRGFSHQEKDSNEPSVECFQYHRSKFFEALAKEIEQRIAPEWQATVGKACSTHLNEACRREAEVRPARFDNRGPTLCNWKDCTSHVPRAGNDFKGRLQQALFTWLVPVFQESANRECFRRSVEHWVEELNTLARGWSKKADEEAAKRIKKRLGQVYRNLVARVKREGSQEAGGKFAADWREHYRKAITEIIKGGQGGRVRYCRKHSLEFVNCRLEGRLIPNREDITEGDLVSRKQQILFRRIWRLVESRLLPLARGVIDRVVVERVAFDVLAGPAKKRLEVSQEKASEMYWYGPQWGFASTAEMLAAEFGGRCAYCAERNATQQIEHLFPRSAFPFDSYFNLLPACSPCNTRKGSRTPLEAGMVVHESAYSAYEDYLLKLKNPPHIYHNIKKGLLKLLCRPSSAGAAERRLNMLANDLVTIAATQRSPRPLARYLAGKLETRSARRPTIAYCAGRHTALYRSILLPDYQKEAARTDLRNHAIDAIILGCDLPSAAALENKDWNSRNGYIGNWMDQVKRAAPDTLLGIPRVEPVMFIPNFENDLGGGYCSIDLSAFNWNRKRKSTHALDPFGETKDGRPLKRVPATGVLTALLSQSKRDKQISLIANAGLRSLLAKDPSKAPERYVRWLQNSIHLEHIQKHASNHPADQARYQLLKRFVEASPAKVLAGDEGIPPTIGIRCLNMGSMNKLGVLRLNQEGLVFQRYQAQPVIRELVVGYRLDNGVLDRSKPAIYVVSQIHSVRMQKGSTRIDLETGPESPLRGRPHGSREPQKAFLDHWQEEFNRLLAQEGLLKVFRIRQGCVIEKMDGARFQFRNFDKRGPWMKASSFKHIRRVLRSPLKAD